VDAITEFPIFAPMARAPLLSLLATLLTFGLHAQDVRMGPRVGIGLAAQSVGGLFQNTSNLMPAPLFGWHFEVPLHPQVSFTPEVLYMTKGFMVRNPFLATRDQSIYRYLEVPLLAKVSIDKKSDGMFLLIGPSLGYFLSGRFRSWLDGEQILDFKYNLSTSERRFQFSGLVGLGMEGHRWGFDVRAQTSLTPFDRFVRSQNVVYALTLAYRMGGEKD